MDFSPEVASAMHRSFLRSAALKRFQSMPSPFCFDGSPTHAEQKLREEGSPSRERPKFISDEDENSQDSAVSLTSNSDDKENKLLITDFRFAEPIQRPPRRTRILSDQTNSPLNHISPARKFHAIRQLSAPAGTNLSFCLEEDEDEASPIKLRHSSLTFSPENDEGDDGFLELLDDPEDESKTKGAPQGLESLFRAPVLSSRADTNTTPTTRGTICMRQLSLDSGSKDNKENQENIRPKKCSRRGLFRSPTTPCLVKAHSFDERPRPSSFKRSEPCCEGDTPVQNNKRRKSVVGTPEKQCKAKPKLQRCHSEAEIKSALNVCDDQDLIGDFSKSYSLPLIRGKHQDLKAINPSTMEDVLNGVYDHVIESATVIDCRYPYEYEGGHIRDAKNIYTKLGIMEEFMSEEGLRKYMSTSEDRPKVLIFHCEFSSERAPNLSRFLRNKDRDSHKDCYPQLNYPEIYLLEGGYKAFFEHKKCLCVPETYMRMLDENHADDMRHFRAKSKSWAGEGSKRINFRPGLKF